MIKKSVANVMAPLINLVLMQSSIIAALEITEDPTPLKGQQRSKFSSRQYGIFCLMGMSPVLNFTGKTMTADFVTQDIQ